MRLPSYLTLGGVGTKIKPFTQNKTDLKWTSAYSGLVSRPHDCSFFNPTNKSLNYTAFDIVTDKKINNILVILHFGDEAGFNSALGWVNSSSNKDSMGHPKNYFLVTPTYATCGTQTCINYCRERREIAFIHYPATSVDVDLDDLRLNNGFTGWGTTLIWIDRITVGALDSASINRLLQVPYGYDHLKPISVGDKLGLVYWDGTITAGNNFVLVKDYTVQTDAEYLNYYDGGVYKKIRDTAGTTMWFDGGILQAVYHDGAWDSSAGATNELLPHLFHVI